MRKRDTMNPLHSARVWLETDHAARNNQISTLPSDTYAHGLNVLTLTSVEVNHHDPVATRRSVGIVEQKVIADPDLMVDAYNAHLVESKDGPKGVDNNDLLHRRPSR